MEEGTSLLSGRVCHQEVDHMKPDELMKKQDHDDEPGWYDRDEVSWEDQLHQEHLDSFSEEP